METKKMTLKEAQEFVRNTKYIVWTEDESKKLQEKLFEIGCEWADFVKKVKHTEHPFLYVNERMKLSYSSRGIYMCFEKSKKRYMPTEDILNIEIEQSKPKFDPKTLQAFDKVLVRDNQHHLWKAKFFHCKKGEHYYTIDDVIYPICIPFNDDTKHLHGTREDAPEFYKLD